MTDEPPLLSSWKLKLNWAGHHRAQLMLGLERWLVLDQGAALVVTEEGHHHQVCRFRLLKPMPRELSLHVGDCVNNARQALDHLAYALSIKITGSNPPTNEFTSEFPLFTSVRDGNQGRFDNSLERKVGANKEGLDAIDPAIYTELERCQPYHGGDMEILAALDALDRIDKHRFLPVVAGVGVVGNWTFSNMVLGGMPRLIAQGPVEDDTIVAEWISDPMYNGGVQAKLDTMLLFAKDSTVLPEAIVLNVLHNILSRIGGDIIPRIERLL